MEMVTMGAEIGSPESQSMEKTVSEGSAAEWDQSVLKGKEAKMTKAMLKNDPGPFQEAGAPQHGNHVKRKSSLVKRFTLIEFFPGIRTKALKGDGHRNRGYVERIHIFLEDPASARASTYFLGFIVSIILVSCITYVMETLPLAHQYEGVSVAPPGHEGEWIGIECELCKPVPQTDADGYQKRIDRENDCYGCEPGVTGLFIWIENVAVSIFTIEYIGRLCTGWAVPSESELEDYMEMETEESDEWELFNPDLKTSIVRVLVFSVRWMNIVDLIAIVPHYINLLTGNSDSFTFIRLLRLFRILRLLKIRKMTGESAEFSDNLLIFVEVFHRSKVALTITMIYTAFITILWAAIIFVIEKGAWEERTGRYMIQDSYYLGDTNPSAFTSIPDTFWWVLVTLFTVGYGDMTPQTPVGKVFGVMVMYSGVMLLAMPITIIGGKFHEIYDENMKKRDLNRVAWLRCAKVICNPIFESRHSRLKMAFVQWKKVVMSSTRTETIVQQEMKQMMDTLHIEDLHTKTEAMLQQMLELQSALKTLKGGKNGGIKEDVAMS